MRAYSGSTGSFTFTIISAFAHTSSAVSRIVPPARSKSTSGMPLPSPAERSTNTVCPALTSALTPAGTRPTRYSLFLISFGTPTIIAGSLLSVARGDRCRPRGLDGVALGHAAHPRVAPLGRVRLRVDDELAAAVGRVAGKARVASRIRRHAGVLGNRSGDGRDRLAYRRQYREGRDDGADDDDEDPVVLFQSQSGRDCTTRSGSRQGVWPPPTGRYRMAAWTS